MTIRVPGQDHIGPGLRLQYGAVTVVPTAEDLLSPTTFRAFVERTVLGARGAQVNIQYCVDDLSATPGDVRYEQPVHRGMPLGHRQYVSDHMFDHLQHQVQLVRDRSERLAADGTAAFDSIVPNPEEAPRKTVRDRAEQLATEVSSSVDLRPR